MMMMIYRRNLPPINKIIYVNKQVKLSAQQSHNRRGGGNTNFSAFILRKSTFVITIPIATFHSFSTSFKPKPKFVSKDLLPRHMRKAYDVC